MNKDAIRRFVLLKFQANEATADRIADAVLAERPDASRPELFTLAETRAAGLERRAVAAPPRDLSALRPEDRECVELVASGCTWVEAADKLGIPVGTFKTRYHRAGKTLSGIA